MRKIKTTLGLTFFFILFLLAQPILAEESSTVKATIQSEVVSMTVNKSSIDYGLVYYSPNENNPVIKVLANTLEITNNGNVSANIEVMGSDAIEKTDGNKVWEITSAAVAVNKFRHGVAFDELNYTHFSKGSYATVKLNAAPSEALTGIDMKFYAPLVGSYAGTFETNVYFRAVKS